MQPAIAPRLSATAGSSAITRAIKERHDRHAVDDGRKQRLERVGAT